MMYRVYKIITEGSNDHMGPGHIEVAARSAKHAAEWWNGKGDPVPGSFRAILGPVTTYRPFKDAVRRTSKFATEIGLVY